MWVVGLAEDRNYYVIDMLRDRLNLTERTKALIGLRRLYSVGGNPVRGVGYEDYGLQADIEHIKSVQEQLNYRFEVTPLGGSMDKKTRIRRLVPICEQGRMYLPDYCIRANYRKESEDLVRMFLEQEYDDFPVCLHDDMLDALSRITDEELMVAWPEEAAPDQRPAWMKDVIVDQEGSTTAWMGQ